MAKRKYSRKGSARRNRRKIAYRKKRTFKRRSKVPRALTNFPNTMTVKFKYNEEFYIDAGLDSITSYAFRANSLYDPNYSSVTNHKPMGFSQWMPGIYQKYKVISSKVHCTPLAYTTSVLTPGRWQIYCDKDPTRFNATSTLRVMESPFLNYKKFQNINGVVTNGAGRTQTSRFNYKTWAKKIKNKDPETSFTGNYDTNPVESIYYVIVVMPAGGNDPGYAYFSLTIEYTAVLFDPVFLALS